MNKSDKPQDKPLQPARDPHLTLRSGAFKLNSLDDGDDVKFEMRFFENVIEEDPCNEDALMLLGHAYTRRGEFQRGLEIDRRLTRLRPDDPTAFYNLACSYSLMGSVDEAYAALEKAFGLGYRDLAHVLKDPDLEKLREDSDFRRFVSRFIAHDKNGS
jgi:tetratricopeptide (TPR) repeat protein